MLTTALPARITVPFADAAAAGDKQLIPVVSPGVPGRASYTTGFPHETMIALSAGGTPPYGSDFNGLFNAISSGQRWASAGGFYPFDTAFSTAVGGYPKGCMLASAAFDGFWVSQIDNNTANPDTGGAGWVRVTLQGGNFALDTGTANVYEAAYSPEIITLVDGLVVFFNAGTSNTGASTFSPDGLTAKPILGAAHQPLEGGEIISGGDVQLIYISFIDSWVVLSSTGGSPQVPIATKTLHATNYSQVLALVAASRGATYVNGSGSITTGTYLVDTTAFTPVDGLVLQLPAIPLNGDSFTFIDPNNNWGNNYWSLDLNGKTIEGLAGPLTSKAPNAQWSIFYNGTRWEFF